jgi:hypothetical protein
MSDESSRSARPYGQRRNDGAPSWWAALDRADLPDTEGVPAAHRRWYEEAAVPRLEIADAVPAAPAYRGWLIGLLIAMACAAVLGITWLVNQEVFYVALLIGVPVALAAAVTIVMARRSG